MYIQAISRKSCVRIDYFTRCLFRVSKEIRNIVLL